MHILPGATGTFGDELMVRQMNDQLVKSMCAFVIYRQDETRTLYHLQGSDREGKYQISMWLREETGDVSSLAVSTVDVYGFCQRTNVKSADILSLRTAFNFFARPLLRSDYSFDPAEVKRIPVHQGRNVNLESLVLSSARRKRTFPEEKSHRYQRPSVH